MAMLFANDDEIMNSEDFQDILQAEMDELEDKDEFLNGAAECGEECPDCEASGEPTPDASLATTEMFDRDLWAHSLESYRPTRTFLHDGEIVTGKALKKLSPEKYLFSTLPSNGVKLIHASKLNK